MVDGQTQTMMMNIEFNSRNLFSRKNHALKCKTQTKCAETDSENRDSIDFDPAIVSFGRFNDDKQHVFNESHPSNDQYDETNVAYRTSSNHQQQINIVEQMIAQPKLSHALMPKHFRPKQITNNQWYQSDTTMNCSSSYPYRQYQYYSRTPFSIVPSYHIHRGGNSYARYTEQYGRFRRNNNRCIRDDHRINTSIQKSQNDTGTQHQCLLKNRYFN